MHDDREPPRAGGEIIAKKPALPALVQSALRIQRERTSRNDQPFSKTAACSINICHRAPRNGSGGQDSAPPASPNRRSNEASLRLTPPACRVARILPMNCQGAP